MSPGHVEMKIEAQEVVAAMDERLLGPTRLVAIILVLVGVVSFVFGLMSDPQQAWTALVWNWAFFSGISIGGGILVAASTIASGRWIRSIRRIAESLTGFLPVSFVLMLVLFFGIEHVYEWVAHPPPAKAAYLDAEFFMIRQTVGVAILYLLVLRLVYLSLRPDVGRVRDTVSGWRRRLYDRIARDWEGTAIEVERSIYRKERLAPAVAVVYAIVWTVWAWDWMMSIDPHWFSTLFGAWIFMTHFLLGIGATAFLATIIRRHGSFSDVIDSVALHDIGKMLFAFTVFWTYLFFAQYLVIWYGRLPEETGFVKLRLWNAYEPIAIAVLAMAFLIPFLGLLGVRPKKSPLTLAVFAKISMIGLWLFHLLVIGPGVFPDRIALGPVELGIAAGVAGAFALSVLAFQSAFPAIALSAGVVPDPESEERASLAEPNEG